MSRASVSFGVCAGATIPCLMSASISSYPASPKVGVSGTLWVRSGDPELGVIGNSGLQEVNRALFAIVGHDLYEGDPRGIVDTVMDELPCYVMMTVHHKRLPSGHAMPNGADSAELFDIDMDEFAWLLAFIAANRFGRLQGTEPVKPAPSQHAADGSCRDAKFAGDLLAGVALSARSLHRIASGLGSLTDR